MIYKKPISITIVSSMDPLHGAKTFLNSHSDQFDIDYLNNEVINRGDGSRTSLEDECIKTLSMNLTFNKLVHFEFLIIGSMVFRDFLYTFNSIGAWAYSSRTIQTFEQYKDFYHDISEEFWDGDKLSDNIIKQIEIADEHYELVKNSGKSPNECLSQYINYGTHTTYWASINLNELLKILVFMEKRVPLFFKYYGIKMINAIDKIEDGLFSRIYEKVKDKIYYMDLVGMYLKNEDMIPRIQINDLGMGLYSHLVRHSDVTLTGFLDQFVDKSDEEIRNTNYCSDYSFDIGLDFKNPDRLKSIVRTRICWMGKNNVKSKDSWMNLLDGFINTYIKDDIRKFANYLPCKGNCNNCTIVNDMIGKVYHRESGLPCAIMIESKKVAEERLSDLDNKLNKLYVKLFDEGIVKDNPENKLRKIYENKDTIKQ